MALQASGQISLSDIATEFGDAAPHALSEFYGVANGIPTVGNPISLTDFYGASNGFVLWDGTNFNDTSNLSTFQFNPDGDNSIIVSTTNFTIDATSPLLFYGDTRITKGVTLRYTPLRNYSEIIIDYTVSQWSGSGLGWSMVMTAGDASDTVSNSLSGAGEFTLSKLIGSASNDIRFYINIINDDHQGFIKANKITLIE